MDRLTQTSNPIYQFATAKLGLRSIWDFDSDTLDRIVHVLKRANIDAEEESSLVTIPFSSRYMPPLMFNRLAHNEWRTQVSKLYSRSAHSFIAELYTSLLSRRGEVPDKLLHMFWDGAIPKPTHSTALFWLLHCESWPLLSSDLSRLAKYADHPESFLSELFPPQPLVLPQHLHYTNQATHTYGYAKQQREAIGHYGLGYLFSQVLSRSDREKFAAMNPDSQLIYRPRDAVFISSHSAVDDSMARHICQTYAKGAFTSAPMAAFDSGHAWDQIIESHFVLEQLNRLRGQIMDKATIIPGLPTHRDNIYNYPGSLWRSYNETHLATNCDPELTPFTNDGSEIQMNESTFNSTPIVAPRFWFGFSTPAESINERDSNEAMRDWVQDYAIVRPFALKCLFSPDAAYDAFGAHVHSESVSRRNRLSRYSRIAKPKSADESQVLATTETMREALKNTAFTFTSKK